VIKVVVFIYFRRGWVLSRFGLGGISCPTGRDPYNEKRGSGGILGIKRKIKEGERRIGSRN
jgi:hypothetical protein